MITKESSKSQFAMCQKIDSKTLIKLNVKLTKTNTRNKTAYAIEGIIPVREITMPKSIQIATN